VAGILSTPRPLPNQLVPVLAGAAVVLLCAAAPITLEVEGRVSPGGWVLFGGTAGVLAVLACALTLRARTPVEGGTPDKQHK